MNRARSQASGYAIAMLVACSAPAVVAEETVSFDPQHNPQPSNWLTSWPSRACQMRGWSKRWLRQAIDRKCWMPWQARPSVGCAGSSIAIFF